jgi:hypothetical protein
MFKPYLDYLKDNPEGYWFKNKLYGWGWVPVKWQGWLVIGAFIGFLLWTASTLPPDKEITDRQLIWFFVKVVIAIAVVITICFMKGERPRWRWGLPEQYRRKH